MPQTSNSVGSSSTTPKLGVWILGALGDISTTMICGNLTIRSGLTSTTGLVSELHPFAELPLTDLSNFVFGGVDLAERTLQESAEGIYHNSGTLKREALDIIKPELGEIERDIVRLDVPDDKKHSQSQYIESARSAIRTFREKHSLTTIVVVNLTSAEPTLEHRPELDSLFGLESLFAQNAIDSVNPGTCLTYAALKENCGYINFSPNIGADLGSLQELAEQQGLPYCGNDGKTGETLIKTVLAPMFLARNLQVLSWEGTNLLGNGDGATLHNPENRQSKLKNKGEVLEKMLGYSPHSGVDINYVPSLGDWKTAWDLIHFQGFLDVKMTMQFTWQGCDSILAAPLVLDMARFTAFAMQNGESGSMKQLACFFKNPLGCDEMAFYQQFESLVSYALEHLAE
ncbi:MAG: inositol-3-phosphate synthase [Pseudomonadales bacterium]|nr:inositol-3-phosphate synthase [Pseudomonadales bacterium]